MNINEIFGSPTRIERKFKDSILNNPDAIKSRAVRNAQKALGSGYFSYVVNNPNDINGVTKANLLAVKLAEDPFYLFAQYTIKNHLAEDNIFIPRIYSVQVTEDSTGRGLYRMRTEKLLPTSELRLEQLLGAIATTGIEMDAFMKKMDDGQNILAVTNRLIFILSSIAKGNNNADVYLDDDSPQREKLEQAMSVWRMIQHIDRTNFVWDIHEGNFMWRSIGTGVQLVLTDLLVNGNQVSTTSSVAEIFRDSA